ncbi:hypothetical protein B0H14DRAFT_2948708 [Mycena olivaceomarginata]|nr:hypothetical protein B0H14DRAFT_2970820 [Mycena olivaceomarginata]KAJ7788444.1 hypothetical protein B0H14DRAFT_2948708 [Mycena olivaceomarginata]
MIALHTFIVPFHHVDVKSWATHPSTFFMFLLPSFALYLLTLVRGIQYNKKHDIKGLDGAFRIIILLIAASSWTAILLSGSQNFGCWTAGRSICPMPLLTFQIWLLQYVMHVLPMIRIPLAIGLFVWGSMPFFWLMAGCTLNPKSNLFFQLWLWDSRLH